MGKTLTITIVFEAGSLNYGEGFANISELKKFNRADGNIYSFASRQALRYDIVRLGNEWFDWNLDVVSKEKGTVQFKDEVTIEDSVEMDLFGYLKTGKKSLKRAAVVRLSHAVSLEPYNGDMEFLNNMGLAERNKLDPNLANIENHISLYTYTITIDLDKIGIDSNDNVTLSNEQRFERVQQFLEIVKLLSRHIRGRQENLAPLFIVGGVYPYANPLFQGRIQLKNGELQVNPLIEVMETTFAGSSVKGDTLIGIASGKFSNEQEFRSTFAENISTIEETFQVLINQVAQHYGVKQNATVKA
ncbi:CRISPR-associated protein DevR [Ureibacillus massiliensis 4400831 = CIP 108448 = CCUG 49529]|uniref:CRISPR-associated protein DevR n=1 Tax=Ureibacillus massiliensis 4400831 = CIP 108448 = CCUG 49529 TaxID=1211035 RepID=A0A0A3J9E4_9BACL|nr:type I-B CRISPR-associated protein Cas7/Cst2/DevR [Ureibacillus massiliensis]KGR92395.1 CRISPR-associated protein DevR [Ureibacillus massiliensis 4400831 = CIP 108448 = CCUG 49529]